MPTPPDRPRKITTAMILAAGMGTRLHPHTLTTPKPMVRVDDKTLLQHMIEKLKAAGVQNLVVNTHYLGDQIAAHLHDMTDIQIHLSPEDVLLETGGGVKKALPLLGTDPFFLINGDALWEDGDIPTLFDLNAHWDDTRMDCLLLLQDIKTMTTSTGVGDYDCNSDGRARRAHDKNGAYMFTGIRITHPRILNESPDRPFSFLSLMDRAERDGRLFALRHQGHWHHISTPEDLSRVNTHFQNKKIGDFGRI